jgi:hypothetical protein
MAGLQEVCTVQLDLEPDAQEIGVTPVGARRVLVIREGAVKGDRLSGFVLPGGADWIVFDQDGWGRLDVRMQWQMDDGPIIYVAAKGVVHFNEKVLCARDAGQATAFEDQYYRTLMHMEAATDGAYAWVNHAVFVTEGRISPGETGRGVAFRTFIVT